MEKHLRQLLVNLHSLNPEPALEALREWSKSARFRDAVSLVRAAPEADRPVLESAIRDVLCGYPEMLWAAPVCLHLRSESLHWLDLPDPASVREPAGVEWRWQELRRQLSPHEMDEAPGMIANQIQVALLVARMPDPEPPVIDDSWLGALFRHLPADNMLHVSARMILPWTDAVSAALVLRSAASAPGETPENPGAFLTDHAWSWACDAGRAFAHFADA